MYHVQFYTFICTVVYSSRNQENFRLSKQTSSVEKLKLILWRSMLKVKRLNSKFTSGGNINFSLSSSVNSAIALVGCRIKC
jgi:hypothetical protein